MRVATCLAALLLLVAARAAVTLPYPSDVVLHLSSEGLPAGPLSEWPDLSVGCPHRFPPARDIRCGPGSRHSLTSCYLHNVGWFAHGLAVPFPQGNGFNGTSTGPLPTVDSNAYYCMPAVFLNDQRVTVPDDVLLRAETSDFTVVIVYQRTTADSMTLLVKPNNGGYDYGLTLTSNEYYAVARSSNTQRSRFALSGRDTKDIQVRARRRCRTGLVGRP